MHRFNNTTMMGRVADEEKNARLLAALKDGPLYPTELAKRLNLPIPAVQQRLYRLSRKHQVEAQPTRQGQSVRWALAGHWKPANSAAAPSSRVVQPRTLNWRTGTLSYDLDAHRRLAMLVR